MTALSARRVLIDLPEGPLGVRATMGFMRRLVKESRTQPEIRALAEKITAGVPEKDFYGQARAVHDWVRDRIRYQHDPVDLEQIRAPLQTLEAGQGDCDDKCIVEAALLHSIGHPCQFVAMAMEPDNFCHVYLRTKVGDRWIASDTTERQSFGWEPPGAVARMVQDI